MICGTATELRKQLLRIALREIIVRLNPDNQELELILHWQGDACTQLSVKKRATPVGSKARESLVELVGKLADSLDDGEIARILNMKNLTTPRDLRWTKDRVQAFRAHHALRRGKRGQPENVLTGQQARE